MSHWEKIGYRENIRRLQAKRTREKLQFSQVRITGHYLYQLVLDETEDPEMAEQAERNLIAARLRAGETPD